MYPGRVAAYMDRDLLGWLGTLLGVSILTPIFLYLFTGAVVGFLVACGSGPEGTFVVGSSGGDTLELSCAAVRTLVKTGVTVGGSAATVVAVALVAVADLVRGSTGIGR
jgi:hypothetical protein